MTDEFTALNLHPQLVQAVSALGFTSPTPIQTAVIPLLLAGHDVIGQAQTGTGKTAAFALPILHNLQPNHEQVQSLILAPTRELALQVARAIHEYGRFHDVRVLAVYGGQPYDKQIRRLKRGVDVVVGTPGRLLDLIRQKSLDLSHLTTLILDEADEMLSMGFIEDIETILKETPAARQTALFSATLPAEIRQLADRYLRQPQSVAIRHKQMTVATIEQRYYLVNEADKMAALTRLFEMEAVTSTLIFTRTRISTGELANELTVRGFPAEALNGDLSQDAREQVLNRFRHNQINVLVATDVAARGLDIDNISHVINFDLPRHPEIYVHRVGRTARAGKTGIALTLVTPQEQWHLRRIEGYTKQKITRATLPTIEEIQQKRETQLLERMMVWLRRGRCNREREMVTELVAEGNDAIEIAAAALKLARAEEKQRPIARISEVEELQPRQRERGRRRDDGDRLENGNGRSNGRSYENGRAWENGRGKNNQTREKGMVRFMLNAGKTHGVRPNDVVGTIAYHADIPGRAIGAIRIQEEHTLVDVPEQFGEQVLAKTGQYRIHRRAITIERM